MTDVGFKEILQMVLHNLVTCILFQSLSVIKFYLYSKLLVARKYSDAAFMGVHKIEMRLSML